MASITFALQGESNTALVRFIIQGDSLIAVQLLVQHMSQLGQQCKHALKLATLKGRSDTHCHRNRADMLTALLGIALQAEFGRITINKTIDGRTALGNICGGNPDTNTLPSMDWARG